MDMNSMFFSGYRVIEIMNEKELIINYGLKNGAKKGDLLRIYSNGESVIDPNTNQSLGTLDIIKDEVQVYLPYEHFSVCRKVVTKMSGILNPLSNATTTSYEKMDVDEDAITNRVIPNSDKIMVGDKVYKISK